MKKKSLFNRCSEKKKESTGGILVVLFISIIALSCGIVCGIHNVGGDIDYDIVPSTLATPLKNVETIDESSFVPEKISVNLNIPKEENKVVTNTTTNKTTKNNTNSTNNTNNTNKSIESTISTLENNNRELKKTT